MNTIFSISEQSMHPGWRPISGMASVTKAVSPLLSQLDLEKSQYAGIVEEAIYCLIALYLKKKRRFLRARRICNML
jgi:hypothetical protein